MSLPECPRRILYESHGTKAVGLERKSLKELCLIMRTQNITLRCSKHDREATPEECIACGGDKEKQGTLDCFGPLKDVVLQHEKLINEFIEKEKFIRNQNNNTEG